MMLAAMTHLCYLLRVKLHRETRWVTGFFLAGLGLVWACGGIAVLDPDSAAGGAGGAGSSNSSNTTPLCATPTPVGSLEFCSGTQGSGAGDVSCATISCDQDDNTWEADCNGQGCRCKYNGLTECTCASDNQCGGGQSCCPAPFP